MGQPDELLRGVAPRGYESRPLAPVRYILGIWRGPTLATAFRLYYQKLNGALSIRVVLVEYGRGINGKYLKIAGCRNEWADEEGTIEIEPTVPIAPLVMLAQALIN